MEKKYRCFLVILITGMFLVTTGCIQNQPGSTPSTPSAPVTTVTVLQEKYISNETLVSFVDSAVAYVKANGKEKALAEFSNPKGQFIQGELYIYAYDFNGTTLAHPVNPEKIGVNRLNETAGNVGLVIRNMSAMARNGSGFYRFYYINPAHNRTLESKLGYAEKVDDNWWLGSGVYTGPADPVLQNTGQ
jgi:signal transduction histidine kinase